MVANGVSSFLADPDGFGDVIRETSGSTVKNYVYRADDRLAGFSDGTNQVVYYYDALGRRVAKVFSGGVGAFTQSYLHLGGEDRILLAKAGNGEISTFIDGQGLDQH